MIHFSYSRVVAAASICIGGAADDKAELAAGIATGGQFQIPVTVADDTSTTVWAKSVGENGESSTCSASNVTYIEDSTAPSSPRFSVFFTDLDGNDIVAGNAEPSSRIYIYFDNCTSAMKAETVTNASGQWQGEIPVNGGETVNVVSTATDEAGNVSACSSSRPFNAPDGSQTTDGGSNQG